MARPKTIEPCLKCGTPLSARERRRHHCPGSPGPGRPPVLSPCHQCGAVLSVTQSKSHVCAPKPSPEVAPIPAKMSRRELIAHISSWQDAHGHKRRYGTGSILQAKNGTWYGFITVAHDANGTRMRKKLTGRSREEVDGKLGATMKECGITTRTSSKQRPLSNRSYEQLRRLYAEILSEQAASQ